MKLHKRPHWSYSAINQYLRCPLQYYFERVLQIPRTSINSGLLLGSATHEALAFYHGQLKQGEAIDANAVHNVFLKHWQRREDAEYVDYKVSESKPELVDQGIALIDMYLAEPPPENILAVEQTLTVPIQNSDGNYLEKPLVAIVDLLSRTGDQLRITELKTAGRSYGEFEIESSLQATCYVTAIWQTLSEWASVEYVVMVKTKTPRTQRMLTSRTDEDLGRLGDLIENLDKAIQAEIFYPVESPLNCSTCSFRSECKLWKPTRDLKDRRTRIMDLVKINQC